jgi:nitroreductase
MNNDSHSPRTDGSEDLLKIIRARRSVRDYLPDEVPDDVIREMIRAGCHAPSAMNKQPWRFVVIKDRELMKKLSEKAREMWMERLQSRDHQACRYGLMACLIFGYPVKLQERTSKRVENVILNWIK